MSPNIQEPLKVTPTLFIGLGGIGKATLLLLRRQLFLRDRLDLRCFEWLYYDTDPDCVQNQEGLVNKELYDLKPEHMVLASITDHDYMQIVNNKQQHPLVTGWCPDHLLRTSELEAVEKGAGQVRAYGRLPLFVRQLHDRIQKNLTRIENRFGALKNKDLPDGVQFVPQPNLPGTVTKDWNVFVICSAGGGTGSGSFLDFGYLLDNQRNWHNRTLYLVLPVDFDNDIEERYRDRIKANTFAALMELEYLNLTRDDTRRVPVVKYYNEADRSYNWSLRAPYDYNFLFSQKQGGGLRLRDIVEIMADSLFMRYDTVGMGRAAAILDSNLSNDRRAILDMPDGYEISRPSSDGAGIGERLFVQAIGHRNFAIGLSRIVYPSFLMKQFCIDSMLVDILECMSGKSISEEIAMQQAESLLDGLHVIRKSLNHKSADFWSSGDFHDIYNGLSKNLNDKISSALELAPGSNFITDRCHALLSELDELMGPNGIWRKQLNEAAASFAEAVKSTLQRITTNKLDTDEWTLQEVIQALQTLISMSGEAKTPGGKLASIFEKVKKRRESLDIDVPQFRDHKAVTTPQIAQAELICELLQRSREEATAHFSKFPAKWNRSHMEAKFKTNFSDAMAQLTTAWRTRLQHIAVDRLEQTALVAIESSLDPVSGLVSKSLRDESKRLSDRKKWLDNLVQDLEKRREALSTPPDPDNQLYIPTLYQETDNSNVKRSESLKAFMDRYRGFHTSLPTGEAPNELLMRYLNEFDANGRSATPFRVRSKLVDQLFGKTIRNPVVEGIHGLVTAVVNSHYDAISGRIGDEIVHHDAISELVKLISRKAPAEAQGDNARLQAHVNTKFWNSLLDLKNRSIPLLTLNMHAADGTRRRTEPSPMATKLLCINRNEKYVYTSEDGNLLVDIDVGGITDTPDVNRLVTAGADSVSLYTYSFGFALAQLRSIYEWYAHYVKITRDNPRFFYRIDKNMSVAADILLAPTLHYPVLFMVDAARILYKAVILGVLSVKYQSTEISQVVLWHKGHDVSFNSMEEAIRTFVPCVIAKRLDDNQGVTPDDVHRYRNEHGFVDATRNEKILWIDMVQEVERRETVIKEYFGPSVIFAQSDGEISSQYSKIGEVTSSRAVGTEQCLLDQYRCLLREVSDNFAQYVLSQDSLRNEGKDKNEKRMRCALLGLDSLKNDIAVLEEEYRLRKCREHIPDYDVLDRDPARRMELQQSLMTLGLDTNTELLRKEKETYRKGDGLWYFSVSAMFEDLLRFNNDTLERITNKVNDLKARLKV